MSLLEQEWNAWYDHSTPGRSAKDYDKGLFGICSVKTVEEFWGCYNNLPTLFSLDLKCGFHFMKKGVKPTWEDPSNKTGGIWKIRVKKEDAGVTWKEILMALIGDVYKDFVEVEVNGVSVTNKLSEYVFTIWTNKDLASQDTVQYFLGLMPEITLISDPAYTSCSALLKATV